jgi:hypothetical protein
MGDDVKTNIPDTQVPDTQETFENLSQGNGQERSDSQTAWEVNRKRTYDVYQDFDVQAVRAYHKNADKLDTLALQAMQNAIETANMVGKQAVRHADVAADALWTDELNPVMHGTEAVLAGQAPVNSQLASTASLDTVYMNLTAQNGELVTAIIGLANSVAAQNTAVTAALTQLIQNAKQGTVPPVAGA